MFFLFILTGSMIGLSCEKEPTDFIELDEEAVLLKAEGEEKTIALTSNAKWRIVEKPDWLTIDPLSGDQSATITLKAEQNEESPERTGEMIVVAGDAKVTVKITQSGRGDVIEPEEKSVTLNVAGETKTLALTANVPWEITQTPPWLTVHPLSGDRSATLTLSVDKNKAAGGREGEVVFVTDKKTVQLPIWQYGRKDYIGTPWIPVFGSSRVRYNAGWTDLEFVTSRLFVNPSVKGHIYLGSLLGLHSQSNVDIPAMTGYTFDPVTASADGVSVKSKTFYPSREAEDAYVAEIMATGPKQNYFLKTDNDGTEFYSYRQLHVLGIASMGIELDKAVAGASYREKEMTKNCGIVFAFKKILFSLAMDFPDDGKITVGDLKESDKAKDPAYVNSISYGNTGLLVVESDAYYEDIRAAIQSAWAGDPLSEDEKSLIEAADIGYVYFDKEKEVHIKKGKGDAVNAFREGLEDRKNVYPVEFSIADFNTNGEKSVSFSFTLPARNGK